VRRALVVERPGQIALVERADLEPGPGEVVIAPVACGLCGTDLELLRGLVDPEFVTYPLTLGHEWSGVVRALGAGVERIAVGDHVVAECIVPCGHCPRCRVGATNTCETYVELGFTREGGASDQVVVDARLVHRLEPGVSLVDAALTEPASVVMRGYEKLTPAPGERILVIGDGTIALLAAHLAAQWSPAEIVLRGLRPAQRELALASGATSFIVEDDESLTGAFDLVVEAAGATRAIERAIASVRRGGRVLLLGLPPTGQVLELPADLMVNNDLTVAASFGYTSGAWTRVVSLLNSGRITPGMIVTHRFPLERFGEAFRALEAGTDARGKVMLEVAGHQPPTQPLSSP
jgi:2-desacetyl-2-hydroxyethyl bacteriochlorophyllide A dehydrogenase